MENLVSALEVLLSVCHLEARSDGDIVLVKMPVHYASIIYCYKAMDTA